MISIEPVADAVCGMCQMSFDIRKQIIFVSGKEEFSVIINGLDVSFGFLALDMVVASMIMAMYDFISDGPNKMPFIPDAHQDFGRP